MLKWIPGFVPIISLTAALLAVGGLGAPAAEEDAAGLHVKRSQDTLSIFDGERPLLRYRYQGTDLRKPYVDQLFSPAGVQVLRDSPPDHKHHHGLMYAVSVDGVNFWEEFKPTFGSEKNRSIKEVDGGVPDSHLRSGFAEELDWVRPAADKPLLVERREIQVLVDRGLESDAAGFGATLVDWHCRFAAPEGKDSAVITGTHYNGLGMRFVQSMDKGGRFFNADDKLGEEGPHCRLTCTKWIAYTAKADGKPVTVALFDDPANFRHPQKMFSMTAGFAYMSATMNEWKEPVTVKAGQPLELRYGVAVWDGETDKATVEKLYQRWAELSPRE
jgi:hypothetical protein